MTYKIVTQKLRDHGITEQTEFTPEQFAQFQAQYDAILAQEKLENQPPAPDPVAGFTNAVQAYMDAKAREKGYDNLLSAVTYAEEPTVVKFQNEGKAFRAWRSLVWAKCYAILEEIQNGRPVPTTEQVIAELPVFTEV